MKFAQIRAIDEMRGVVLPGAVVSVKLAGTATLATLYNKNGTALTNPFACNDEGIGGFSVLPGRYDVRMTSADGTYSPTPMLDWEVVDASAEIAELASVLDKMVSVKSPKYGAKGDGSVGDTARILDCIGENPGKEIIYPRGTYYLTQRLLASAAGSKFRGAGRGLTKFTNATGGDHAVVFAPPPGTSYVTQCALQGIAITGLDGEVTGAAALLQQCEDFSLDDILASRCPEGIIVAGGQLNNLTNFRLRASSLTTVLDDMALLTVRGQDLGSGVFQTAFTNELSNFSISGGASRTAKRIGACIRIAEADGLNFANGYLNFATDTLVRAKMFTSGKTSSAVHFDNMYFDGVSMTDNGTPHCLTILDDGDPTTWFYGLSLSDTCILANTTGDAVVVTKPEVAHLKLDGPVFQNVLGRTLNVAPPTNSDRMQVSVNGGHSTNSGGMSLANTDTFSITDHKFSRLIGTYNTAIKLAGQHRLGLIDDDTFVDAAIDLDNAATFTNRLILGPGNNSNNATNTVMGLTLPNMSHADPKVLSHHDRGFQTSAVLTFGGLSTGIAYNGSSHYIKWTRISDVVFYEFYILLTSKGSATGIAEIGPLPVPAHSANIAPANVRFGSFVAGVGERALGTYIGPGSSVIRISEMDASGTPQSLTNTAFSNTSYVMGSGFYFAA